MNTNGTLINRLTHFAVGFVLALIGILLGSPGWGLALAAVWAWKQEAGEQSERIDWRFRSVWSDHWPFHRNWSTDDRLDLASTIAGALAALVVAALI